MLMKSCLLVQVHHSLVALKLNISRCRVGIYPGLCVLVHASWAMRLGPCALAHTVNNWVTILSSALYTLEELCLVAPFSVFVLRQVETIDSRCASSCSTDTRRYSVSWQCLVRSLMRICHPSTSLLVRTAFPNTNQALGGYKALSIQVTCTYYWKRSRRPGLVLSLSLTAGRTCH